MPSRPRRARHPDALLVAVVVLVAAAAALAGATLMGRGDPGEGCNECPPPAVAATGEVVWVAQGGRLTSLDAGTGRVAWTRQVVPPTPGGGEALGAVAVAPEGVWVAWGRGAALVPGHTGAVVRVPLGPPAAVPSLARVAGRTWLGLGRRVVGLHPDGRAMPTVRVAAPATVSAAGTVLLVDTGEGEVALDPRLGVRTAAAPRVRGPAWVADPALGTVTPVDPATGAPTGAPLEFEDLTGVAEAPDGTGYAVQGRGHMGVARLEADGPSVVWRTAIPPA